MLISVVTAATSSRRRRRCCAPAGCGQRTGSSSHQVIPRCQWMRCGCASFWTRALRSLSTVCVLLGLSGGGRMRRCSPAGWRGVVRVSGTGACSGPRADSQNPAPHSTQPSTPWALRRSTRDWGRGRSWRRSDPPLDCRFSYRFIYTV